MRWLISCPLKLLFLPLLLVLSGYPAGSGVCFAATGKTTGIASPTSPDIWQATLSDHENAPTFLIAVDKKSQQVLAFERHSPMRVIAEYPCTTGQAEGDKIKNGDLKTPEGVYFVVRHITSGLNYTLYGKEAYPLNYPNPVDRLRKKTGYGIWIHGKGVPLAPRDTQGCVAMNNGDIASLGEKIAIGQPVALAADIVHKPEMSPQRTETLTRLERNVLEWARAWAERSHKMFDYYDAEAYSIAQNESFKNFRSQKERLFKSLPWINTTVSDIQILEGPGYWVTWFNQDYRAPNLSTSGTRRLYWQKDSQDKLRIVGMEWVPGLKSPILVASAGKAPIALPSEPAVATPVAPASTPTEKEAETPAVAVAAPAKTAPPAAAESATATESKPTAVASVAKPEKQSPAAATSKPTPPSALEASAMLEEWRRAWEKGDLEAYLAFYTPKARQAGRDMRATAAQKQKLWNTAKPAKVTFEDVRITRTARGFSVKMIQLYTDAKGYSDKGVKTLQLEADGTTMRIAREDWTSVSR